MTPGPSLHLAIKFVLHFVLQRAESDHGVSVISAQMKDEMCLTVGVLGQNKTEKDA